MKQIFLDILNKLKSLNSFNYIYIYNNHVDRARLGLTTFDTPACFVEIVQQAVTPLGSKMVGSDLSIRFHIVLMELDGLNGSTDQNLNILTYRNIIRKNFVQFKPTNCGLMSSDGEIQDYKHDNLYHYVQKFVCHYIDVSAFSENILEPYWIIWDQNGLNWSSILANWDDLRMPALQFDVAI